MSESNKELMARLDSMFITFDPNDTDPEEIDYFKNLAESNNKVSTIPPSNFLVTLQGNVDNKNLTDEDFRALVRNTLPIVKFKGNEKKEYK